MKPLFVLEWADRWNDLIKETDNKQNKRSKNYTQANGCDLEEARSQKKLQQFIQEWRAVCYLGKSGGGKEAPCHTKKTARTHTQKTTRWTNTSPAACYHQLWLCLSTKQQWYQSCSRHSSPDVSGCQYVVDSAGFGIWIKNKYLGKLAGCHPSCWRLPGWALDWTCHTY